jgi:hypothetical protein
VVVGVVEIIAAVVVVAVIAQTQVLLPLLEQLIQLPWVLAVRVALE